MSKGSATYSRVIGAGAGLAGLLWLAAAVMLLLAPSVRAQDASTPLRQRKLVVGGDADFPPYEFLDADGEPTGFDVELFEAVAEVMDLQVEIHLGPWNEVRQQLEAGEIDAVVGMHHSVERDERVDFSSPYAMAQYAVFVRAGQEGITGARDLAGRAVALQEGALVQDMAEQLGISSTMVLVTGPERALQGLAAGQYDAALLFQHQGLYLSRTLELDNIEVVGPPLAPREYCFAVAEGDRELVTALNEGLAVVEATGRYNELQKRWLGVLEPKGWSWRRSLEVMAWILIPAALVVLLALAQAWILQRRVAQRTRQLVEELAERRRAEEALARERERLLVTLRSIGDAVITTDRQGNIELMNRVAEALLGQSLVEARGVLLEVVLPLLEPERDMPLPSITRRILEHGEPRVLVHAARLDVEGQPLVSVGASPILDHSQERQGVVVALRDITAQRRLERELARAEKLESVGLLAGGIAHDFNNILTGVMGHISLAKAKLGAEHAVQEHLDKAEGATRRARGLTQQLLTFSKGGAPVRRLLAMDHLITEAVDLALAGTAVRPELELASDLWPVEGDPGQLLQVLHNLLLNAAQAQPEGGSVILRAANLELGAEHPSGLEPGWYLRLELYDEGPGIPEEVAQHVFEPFYTTKASGSGLGLTTAYSVSRQHGGWLGLDPEARCGAGFHWLLPASPGAELERPLPEPLPQQGEGRVLVMDDEAVVREVFEAMLSSLGYEVTLTHDGEHAVQAYLEALQRGRPFGVVIMDLTVPGGMGGVEALRQMRVGDPQVRGIVSSGFSDDPVLAHPQEYGFCDRVAKPFRLADLSQVVERALRCEDSA